MLKARGIYIWLPVFWMFIASTLSYLDRMVLAILAPTILADMKMSVATYGWVVAAFSWTYMAANPVWGRILDRLNVRRGMTAAVGLWSAASALHAFAVGPFTFGIFRGLLGAGEGATFPGGVKTSVLTLPQHRRAIGNALCYSGGAIGAIITPLVITPIAVKHGWRAAFLLTGALGLMWVIGWNLISRGVTEISPTVADRSSRALFRDSNMIAFASAYGLGAFPLGFVLNALPLYLSRGLHLTQATIGEIAWIPPLGWEVGFFAWGALADRFGKTRKNVQVMMTVALMLTLPLAFAAKTRSVSLAIAISVVGLFAAAGFLTLALAFALRTHAPSMSASLTGIGAGAWSAVVALAMPQIGRFFDHHRFDAAFYTATAIPFCGYLLWLAFSVRKESGKQIGKAENYLVTT